MCAASTHPDPVWRTRLEAMLSQDFGQIAQLIRLHASHRPDAPALHDGSDALSWKQLDALMDRVAAALQRDGIAAGEVISLCAASSVRYAAVFLGALRAGVAVAPLAPGSTPQSLAGMARDAGARLLFLDRSTRDLLGEVAPAVPRIALDDESDLQAWLAPRSAVPELATLGPASPFNIIYSSGTTGAPKGVLQGHGMRWAHVKRCTQYGYGPDSVTLLSTPLYSNTTLVTFLPAIAHGGCAVLMGKFDAEQYLGLAQDLRATHTMLVPVQYQRLLDHPRLRQYDLSAMQVKFCTSAPFSAALKTRALEQLPGRLIEFYGMTEGGGTCILDASRHPDKLHTVGRPAEGCDMRLIDEIGREVACGAEGEIVGRSASMMVGYHGRPDATREAEWFDDEGRRYIRTGDVGRFDADGFLAIVDRRKDMIISGGFNIYPSDLEAVLRAHPAVRDAAVVGVASPQWGETPAAFVVLEAGTPALAAEDLRAWANARLGKTQRLGHLVLTDELPRNAIGKVLKRELRDTLPADHPSPYSL